MVADMTPGPYGRAPGDPGKRKVVGAIVAVAAVVALILVVVLSSGNGSGGGTSPAGAAGPFGGAGGGGLQDPGGPPRIPTASLPMPTFSMPTMPSLPTPSDTSDPLDEASTDTNPFTPRAWAETDPGPFSIQGTSYQNTAQDAPGCSAAIAQLKPEVAGSCVGMVRSVWTGSGHVAAVYAVFSIDNATDAETISQHISGTTSQLLVTVPSGAGVSAPTGSVLWSSWALAHYLVIIEGWRTDGGDGYDDAGVHTLVTNLRVLAADHYNSFMFQ